MEMRHGWLELSAWSSCIDKLQQLVDSAEFESFVLRGEELSNRWTSLTQLLDHREVLSNHHQQQYQQQQHSAAAALYSSVSFKRRYSSSCFMLNCYYCYIISFYYWVFYVV